MKFLVHDKIFVWRVITMTSLGACHFLRERGDALRPADGISLPRVSSLPGNLINSSTYYLQRQQDFALCRVTLRRGVASIFDTYRTHLRPPQAIGVIAHQYWRRGSLRLCGFISL